MTAQFLPDDYIAPRSNGCYTKLEQGPNKIRILSAPILGWEDWVDNKPIRYRMNEKPDSWHDATRPGKHFWSIVIWNYNEERIQIFHVTQGSIRKAIEDLAKDSDWGAPYFYDIKITREGEGLKTKYTVNPLPHKPVDKAVESAFYENKCNLEALFDGQDPFGLWPEYTKGVFSPEDNECEFSDKVIKLDELGQKCNDEEYEAFIDAWSLTYDKKVLETYIDKRSEHFEIDNRETVALLMKNQDEFEREFKSWLKKYKP